MLKDESIDISIRLEQFQEAQGNYFVTAKYILDLADRAYDLFMSSEVEERRLLITLVLSDLRVKDEKVLYDAKKPFDAILCTDDQAMACEA
jgi:site-specific DNA recombinase